MKNQPNLMAVALLICSIISFTTFAQTKRGDWLAEGGIGNLSLRNNTTQGDLGEPGYYIGKNRGYTISLFPRAGCFVNKNIVIGAGINFNYYHDETSTTGLDNVLTSESSYANSNLGFIPFLRYYFINKNPKSRFYAQVGGGINKILSNKNIGTSYDAGRVSTGSNESVTEGEGYIVEGLIGFNHFVNERVAINTAIGYGYNSMMQNTKYSNTYAGVTYPSGHTSYSYQMSSLNWNVGFTFLIHTKKEKESK